MRGGRTSRCRLAEAASDEAGKGRRNIGVAFADGDEASLLQWLHRLGGVQSRVPLRRTEGMHPTNKLVEHHAQREHVAGGGLVERGHLALDERLQVFGSHVRERAADT